jgi:hypothetical protein
MMREAMMTNPPQPPPGPPQQPGGWQPPYPPPAPAPGYPPYQHQQPYYPPPPTTFTPPPVVKRIPEDQPFVVRPSVKKRLLLFGGLLLFILLLLGCPAGLALSDGGGGAVIFTVAMAVVLLLFGGVLGLQLYLSTSGGPILAVGPAGLWIKTRPTRGQAIWLAWDGIERVYRRRWGLEKMVCVKARDPRAGSNLGAFTALDSSMQQLFFGSGFTATCTFADKPEAEIVGALTHFSAGRCPVQ